MKIAVVMKADTKHQVQYCLMMKVWTKDRLNDIKNPPALIRNKSKATVGELADGRKTK